MPGVGRLLPASTRGRLRLRCAPALRLRCAPAVSGI